RTVEASAALSYAEYARRGFFELVIVAALGLPLLLVADWALRRERPREVTVFRVLAGVLVGLVFIIMASAVQRMMLYQDEYGLTELRVYTTAFMGWLAVLFALFAGTVLSGRPRPFAFAALSSGLVAVLLLHGLNPDALIARTNVARARFDPYYAGALSADAVPVLLQALPGLSPADAVIVASCLLQRWTPLSNADWRSANMARSIARESVQANAGQLLHIMEAANVSASEYIQCGYASRRR
ncbi:MAG: DUF4173 domain-containing protein, partial [Chloroflexi bacterium]|nr:DUF4173 domain-containing protein [Chloroflexota bacterium]